MSATEILEQIRSLNPAERRELVERMRSEFSEDVEAVDDGISPERVAELERRAEELRRHPERGIPWEKVRAELKERR